MAKTKIPENETAEEQAERELYEQVASKSTRSEKTSWNRKMDNLVKAVAQLSVVEEEIMEIMTRKQPLVDAVAEIRQTMVDECIHPSEYLNMNEDGTVTCKFCNRSLRLTGN